jgi:hypothetical protein
MAESTREEKAQDGADVAAALRDRGMEQIEGAKGQLAEGAERVAAAVERTADDLEGDGDNAISGFGRSVASLMRQLAGGLRERDVAEFAGELAQLARRNPGVFLAGSVALGFGIARVFKAQPPQRSPRSTDDWYSAGEWQSSSESSFGEPESSRSGREFDDEERLDLSATAARGTDKSQSDSAQASGAAREEQERKSRQAEKRKAKPQRNASSGSQAASSSETPSKDPTSTGGQS